MPLVGYCWANLQSLHGFPCYGNIARTRNVSECLYLLSASFGSISGYWVMGVYVVDVVVAAVAAAAVVKFNRPMPVYT